VVVHDTEEDIKADIRVVENSFILKP